MGRLTFSGFDSVKKNLGWVEELNLIVKSEDDAEGGDSALSPLEFSTCLTVVWFWINDNVRLCNGFGEDEVVHLCVYFTSERKLLCKYRLYSYVGRGKGKEIYVWVVGLNYCSPFSIVTFVE